MEEKGGWKRRRGIDEKLRRQSEVITINSLSRGTVGIFSCIWSGAEAEKNPGQVMEPISQGRSTLRAALRRW